MAKHGMRIKRICPVCEKAFYALPYLVKNGRIFCSILCRNRGKTRQGYKTPKNACQKISFALRKYYKNRWADKRCPTCNKEFKDYKKSKQIYCSKQCAYLSPEFGGKISQALRGRKLSEEARKNIGLASKKRWRNKEFKTKTRKKISIGRIGIKVSNEGRESMRKAALLNTAKKENHWNWQGGITPIRESLRKTFEYKQWVRNVFERDDYICQKCRKKGNGNIEAHHYPKNFAQILDEYNIKTIKETNNCNELWNLNNGITLCAKCHLETHKGLPKKPWLKS